ncbi:hypothetical protein KIPB_011568, partial [Kipferlia bialata]
VRVSYDIFGPAPARARVMESLSPVGSVTVCSNIFHLLELHSAFQFGDILSKNPSGGTYAQAFLCRAQQLLDSQYTQSVLESMGHTGPMPGPGPREARCPYERAFQAGVSCLAGIQGRHSLPSAYGGCTSPPHSLSGQPHMHVTEGGDEGVSPEGVILLGIQYDMV